MNTIHTNYFHLFSEKQRYIEVTDNQQKNFLESRRGGHVIR